MTDPDSRSRGFTRPGPEEVRPRRRDQAPGRIPPQRDDSRALPPVPRNVTLGLPDDVALLRVVKTPGSHYELNFHYRGEAARSPQDAREAQTRPKTFHFAEMVRPTIAESNREERLAAAKEAYRQLLAYWRALIWLRRKLGVFVKGSRATLIVWDPTDYQIPWEMLFQESKPRGGIHRWLAEEIDIVRWTDVLDPDLEGEELNAPGHCHGGVLLFEATDILPPRTETSEVRRSLNGYQLGAHTPSITTFLRQLDDGAPALDAGLVMVHCHGDRAAETLGDLSRYDFPDYDMAKFRDRKMLVFLNACSSGLALADSPSSPISYNFAEIFLSRGAAGVIATTADVRIADSQEIAVKLLSAAMGGPMNVSTFLRGYRRLAISRFPNDPRERTDPDDYEDFFVAFAFVYFGHPDTTLSLVAAGAPA